MICLLCIRTVSSVDIEVSDSPPQGTVHCTLVCRRLGFWNQEHATLWLCGYSSRSASLSCSSALLEQLGALHMVVQMTHSDGAQDHLPGACSLTLVPREVT
jgi:hypothetical protein